MRFLLAPSGAKLKLPETLPAGALVVFITDVYKHSAPAGAKALPGFRLGRPEQPLSSVCLGG
jgi:hypothetical protein